MPKETISLQTSEHYFFNDDLDLVQRLKKVDNLDTVHGIVDAWNKMQSITIVKSWK